MVRFQQREIRADFTNDSIVVYQAYTATIADPALRQQRFVAPFSFNRMTWIKTSFLWLMERSNWGKKPGQERILRVRMRRAGFDRALSQATLTNYEVGVHRDAAEWAKALEAAAVHIQWDPDRSLRGNSLENEAIQLGLSRHVINEFVNEWIIGIEDLTPAVRKMRRLLDEGKHSKVQPLLPAERVYPVTDAALRLKIGLPRVA